jgi:ubiquinone/menaquinone biosynthesis C-methylase UbiE
MSRKFDPRNWEKLENPERLTELPPANLIGLLQLSGAETVVDYGAGTGMYTLPVARALPHGLLVAVDEHEELLERLRGKIEAPLADHIQTVQTADNHVPLADAAADRLFMVNVLHHVNDDAPALAEIMRLLTPGGLLVAVDFARMDRPVGPPNDHVLALDDARAVLTGMGLRELSVHQPGEIGRYSIAIVAQKAV